MHVHTRRAIDASGSLTAAVASKLEHEIERAAGGLAASRALPGGR